MYDEENDPLSLEGLDDTDRLYNHYARLEVYDAPTTTAERAELQAQQGYTAQRLPTPNVERASKIVAEYFARFAAKISAREANDFFDARNRDDWTRAFASFLERQVDPELPSND